MAYCCATNWQAWVSTFAKIAFSLSVAQACEYAGAIILQGPHQSAQKSTITGKSDLVIQ